MDKDNSGGGGNSGSISIGFDIWIYTLLVSLDKEIYSYFINFWFSRILRRFLSCEAGHVATVGTYADQLACTRCNV
jgi:hypothetical protein